MQNVLQVNIVEQWGCVNHMQTLTFAVPALFDLFACVRLQCSGRMHSACRLSQLYLYSQRTVVCVCVQHIVQYIRICALLK